MLQTPKAELSSGEISPIEPRYGKPGLAGRRVFFRLFSPAFHGLAAVLTQ